MNVLILLTLLSTASFATNVLTQHNDNSRTGANTEETVLTPSNVNATHFGKLFTRKVDGQIYAQPLYANGLVIVATEHNTVYAFDDRQEDPIWKTNLGTSVKVEDTPFKDDHTLRPEIGITGTPVIDPDRGLLYVDAFTRGEDQNYHHQLHTLDLQTGDDLESTEIQGASEGVTFDPLYNRQRPGLLLTQNTVHVAFGSQDGYGIYHGWMFAFDADTLEKKGIFVTSSAPGTSGGSVWMAGQGPLADDDGNIYFTTGNGEGPASDHALSESFVNLNLTDAGYVLKDWFTPFQYESWNNHDLDLGSSGPLLIPGTKLLMGGGKTGELFVLDRANLGRYHADGNQILQFIPKASGPIFTSPVYWNEKVFLWGVNDRLKSFAVENSKINPDPISIANKDKTSIYPGGTLSISADGNNSGIVWATRAFAGDGHGGIQSGVLQAFDANDLTHQLWSSSDDPKNTLGTLAKFCPPTIADGRVYVATFSNELVVYGLIEQGNH